MADESVIEVCKQCGGLKCVEAYCQTCFLHYRYGKAIDRLIKKSREDKYASHTSVN